MQLTRKAAIGAAALVVLAIAAAWLLWQRRTATPVVTPSAAPAASAPVAAASQPAPAEAAIRHPIEEPSKAAEAPIDIQATLIDLFGRKAVLSMFQVDDFPRRFVATVDNLTRPNASTRVWPVNPTPGRFGVDHRPEGDFVGVDNGLRYAPFVQMMETVDVPAAVAAYKRLYPMFQSAYVDLGYPKGYFNDRLVEVIDHLLATPDLEQAAKVHLPEINGPVQPQRPWVLYEFDDPALRALSAGQKILVRMGPVNERRLKAKLAEIRPLIATGTVRR